MKYGKFFQNILGQITVKIPKENLVEIINKSELLHINIEVADNERIRLSMGEYRRAKKELCSGISYEIESKTGISKLYDIVNKRYCFLFGFLLFLALYFLFYPKIVDIRIESDNLDEKTVIESLGSVGFSVGESWKNLNLEKCETELSQSSDIAWANIERVGCVAYVKVKRKENPPMKEEQNASNGNIVSLYDGIVEEVVVNRGIPCVKIGQTVKCGDLLISGVLNDGTTVSAEGDIKIRFENTICQKNEKEITVSSKSRGKICGLQIKILKNPINIFKKYKTFANDCVIIEENKTLTFADGKKFPMSLTVFYEEIEQIKTRILTDEELVESTRIDLHQKLLNEIGVCDLLSFSVSFSLQENACIGTAKYTAIVKGGKFIPFEEKT